MKAIFEKNDIHFLPSAAGEVPSSSLFAFKAHLIYGG